MPLSDWINLDEAARRSGRSVGHLRRRCANEWLAAGTAKKLETRNSKLEWHVNESADPAFTRVKFPEAIAADLSSVVESKRREAVRRKKLLDDWRTALDGGFKLGFQEGQITSQFLSHHEADTGAKLCRATLYNWERRWRSGGLAALVDRRGQGDKGTGGQGDKGTGGQGEFLEEIKRLYLTPRRLKLTICHQIASLKASESGWPIRGYKTCQRFIDSIPKAVVLKMRFGEEAFVNQAEPYLERDYSMLASNEIWCADHHLFDVIVNHQGELVRPWLTAWQDLRSRKIVGWRVFAHDPNSDEILIAFRDAALAQGVPHTIYIDNGKDFDSYALNGRTKRDRWRKRRVRFELDEDRSGVFPNLDVKVVHCWPYHGQSKPIERFFGTVEMQTPVWPTYCGRSTAEKPEDLQLNLERGKAPALNEFSDWFGAWLETYHASVHTGDGMDGKSPDQVFAENLSTERTTTAEAMAFYCLRQTKPTRVTQNGVQYNGLRYGQYDLLEYLGKEVVLRIDDRDLSSLQAWSKEGKFIAIARANARVPVNASAQELREALSQKRQARRSLTSYMEARPRLAEDLPDLLVRAKAAKAQGTSSLGLAATMSPLQTRFDDQLPALRRALERDQLRTAVGAESLTSMRGFLRDDSEAEDRTDPMRELKLALRREE